ncbi:TetR/AcrR family transcriptional regulator [Mesobacterium pallidum]|uniref:TetR/AcrR family transcriptional regulator n=1 Tax=Mesobacterium pallidum TaxID=2872037 RepID=UPI001EE1DD1E
MKTDARNARAAQIEAAAYALLADKGYAGLSMNGVAKAAKASMETLYRWYGDKTGLIRALIAGNTASLEDTLEVAEDADAGDALDQAGARLLTMLLGPAAVALNRAAAADASGDLGRLLAEGGREVVAPRIAALMGRAQAQGVLGPAPEAEQAEAWFALLIGDLQLRRVTGALPQPGAAFIEARSTQALARLTRLFPPARLDSGAPMA